MNAKVSPVSPTPGMLESALVPRLIQVGDLVFDILRRCVTKNNKKLLLADKPYQILLYLALRSAVPGPVSKKEMNIWMNGREAGYASVVDSLLVKIRKELKDMESSVRIETEIAVGHFLVIKNAPA